MSDDKSMGLDNLHREKLRDITHFESRIRNAYDRLPYLEELTRLGETAIVDKVEQVFETYQGSLLVIVKALTDSTGTMVTNEVVDEAYAKLFEAERKLYKDVADFLLEDLEDRWRRSGSKSIKAYENIRNAQKKAFDLENASFDDVTKLSKEYDDLLDYCDGIDATITSSEAETYSKRRWQVFAGILLAIIGALITKLMGLW